MPSALKNYSVTSDRVDKAFMKTNDLSISMEPQVQYLLANEIDVLFYQGNLDLACNTAGNIRWANSMPWKGQTEFTSAALAGWESDAVNGKSKQVSSLFLSSLSCGGLGFYTHDCHFCHNASPISCGTMRYQTGTISRDSRYTDTTATAGRHI